MLAMVLFHTHSSSKCHYNLQSSIVQEAREWDSGFRPSDGLAAHTEEPYQVPCLLRANFSIS